MDQHTKNGMKMVIKKLKFIINMAKDIEKMIMHLNHGLIMEN